MIREVNYVQSHIASKGFKGGNLTQEHAFLTTGSQVELSFISAVRKKNTFKAKNHDYATENFALFISLYTIRYLQWEGAYLPGCRT